MTRPSLDPDPLTFEEYKPLVNGGTPGLRLRTRLFIGLPKRRSWFARFRALLPWRWR